jgi:hypothetical protein
MAAQLLVADVDVTSLVDSWGMVEQIEEVQLADAQLMTSEWTAQITSPLGQFASKGPSLMAGLARYQTPVTVNLDGALVFQGYLRDPGYDPERRQSVMISENVLKGPAETAYGGTGTAINPAVAIVAILRTVLPDLLIDVGGILAAGGPARAAGATVSWNFANVGGSTVMEAVKQIASLSSIAVFEAGGRVTAHAFHAYQGNGSALRQPIDDAHVRSWGRRTLDSQSFNNRVEIGYTGAAAPLVMTDPDSYKANGKIYRTQPFPTSSSVVSADAVSARFFGATYLLRAAWPRWIQPVTVGRADYPGFRLGNRYPVTCAAEGLAGAPMQAIQVRPHLDSGDLELTLAELRPVS